MLRQGSIDGCSVPVVSRSGVAVLDKDIAIAARTLRLAAKHHRNAQRVGLSAPMAAFRLLQRTMAIRFEAGLALNTDKPTELTNTSLMEH